MEKQIILICEDDSMTLKALEHRLKKDGYEILTAHDGKEASNIIKTQKIDLLMSDIHMPFITGLEYITKPFSPDELSLRIKKAFLKNK